MVSDCGGGGGVEDAAAGQVGKGLAREACSGVLLVHTYFMDLIYELI